MVLNIILVPYQSIQDFEFQSMRKITSKEHFASNRPRLTPTDKLKAVREVLRYKRSLKEVSFKYGISRQSLYFWIKKFDPKSGKPSLKNGYRHGRNHPRKLSWKIEKIVLDLVINNPQFSLQKLNKQLQNRGLKVSLKGVYNILLRYELQTSELRQRFSLNHPLKTVFAQAISPATRAKIVEEYIEEGAKISHVCKIWQVSRPTFYSWLRRYQEGKRVGVGDAGLIEALVRKYKKGYEHHRAIGQDAREAILDLVRKRPDYSCHQLYA